MKSLRDEITKAVIDGHMNGFHHGDWEESIKLRIEELSHEHI